MPNYAEEDACIETLLPYLNGEFGGEWHDTSLRPDRDGNRWRNGVQRVEALLSNGNQLAAVEIKSLHGGPVEHSYSEASSSLSKRLVPSVGGSYWISPPPTFEIPVPRQFERRLKRSIERAARTMDLGDERVLIIPRTGVLECLSDDTERSWIMCEHDQMAPFGSLARSVPGMFFLSDRSEHRWPHSFLTPSCATEFQLHIESAISQLTPNQSITVEWMEEWKIRRRNTSSVDHVVFDSGYAFWVSSELFEEVQSAIDAATSKFHRTWAEFHVALLARPHLPPAQLDDLESIAPHLSVPAGIFVYLLEGQRLVDLTRGTVRVIAS